MLTKQTLMREWIILALSFGVGGHLALAMVLHAPERWPWHRAGGYGLLMGVAVYVVVQLGRSLWWMFHQRDKDNQDRLTAP